MVRQRSIALAGLALVIAGLLADRPGVTGSLDFGVDQAAAILAGAVLMAYAGLAALRQAEHRSRRSGLTLLGAALAFVAFAAHRVGIGPPRLVWWSIAGIAAGASLALACAPGARSALAHAARRIPRPLLVLLGLGAGLRLWFVLAYDPGFIGYPDTNSYLNATRGELFTAAYRTAGYPVFLRLVRHLHENLQIVVVVQHLLGLASAGVIYAGVRRLGCGPRLALLPAAAVLLGGTQVYLEHAVLSEALFTFVVICAFYAAARYASTGSLAWIAVAGALAGVSTTVRSAGLLILPVLALWCLLAGRGLRGRALPAIAGMLAGVAVLGVYLGAQERHTGSAALTRAAGFTLYARTAPFADCSRFDPPKAVATVCERKPPQRRRLTPVEYMFLPGVPVRRLPLPPEPAPGAPERAFRWAPDAPLGRFARRAIRHQPGPYLKSIAHGLANTALPPVGRFDYARFGPRSVGYENGVTLIALLRDSSEARGLERAAFYEIGAYWDSPRGVNGRGAGALDAYGRTITFEGPLTSLLALAALAGLVVGRGRRDQILLPGLLAAALILAPIAFLVGSARYHAPAYPIVAAAGALALAALGERRASKSGRAGRALEG